VIEGTGAFNIAYGRWLGRPAHINQKTFSLPEQHAPKTLSISSIGTLRNDFDTLLSNHCTTASAGENKNNNSYFTKKHVFVEQNSTFC
jgi:hypothetical protein